MLNPNAAEGLNAVGIRGERSDITNPRDRDFVMLLTEPPNALSQCCNVSSLFCPILVDLSSIFFSFCSCIAALSCFKLYPPLTTYVIPVAFPSGGLTMLSSFASALFRFVKDEDGPTAVEYAVMLALIIVVCVSAITTLGSNANNTFSYVGAQIAGS
jgi:pilus assembly protein Flp/PilA